MRRTQMTTWMPRSARGAIGGLLALGLLALGPVPSQAGDDTAAPITLPTVTHAGKAPKDALRVQVTKDGVITLGDDATPLGAATLRRALAEKAARPELPSAASSTDLILEVDAELPWSLATWVLQIAADPQVRICRTWFAVRVPSGERGALAVFLPTDRGLRPGPIVQPTFSKRMVTVLSRPTGVAPSLDGLYSALLDRPAAARAEALARLGLLEAQLSLAALRKMAGLAVLLGCGVFLTWQLASAAVVAAAVWGGLSLPLGLLLGTLLNAALTLWLFRMVKQIRDTLGFSRTRRFLRGQDDESAAD